MATVHKESTELEKIVSPSSRTWVVKQEGTERGTITINSLEHSIKTNEYRVVYTSSPTYRIALVKRGLLPARIEGLAKSMGISLHEILRVMGLKKASYHRWNLQKKLMPVNETERVIGLMKIVGQVEDMVAESGDPSGFNASQWVGSWIDKPLPALGGKAPKEFLDTAEGQNLVSNILARIQSGTFS